MYQSINRLWFCCYGGTWRKGSPFTWSTILQVHGWTNTRWVKSTMRERNRERARGRYGNRESSPRVVFCWCVFFTWVQEEEEELLSPFYQNLKEANRGVISFESTRCRRTAGWTQRVVTSAAAVSLADLAGVSLLEVHVGLGRRKVGQRVEVESRFPLIC